MTYAATMTQKGQITIPVAIRNMLGLVPSSRLIFSIEEKRIIARPINNDVLSLYGSVKKSRSQLPHIKNIRKTVLKKLAAHSAKEGL